MDFITHSRLPANVVFRPNVGGEKGCHLIGRHEILLPLIAGRVIEKLDGESNFS